MLSGPTISPQDAYVARILSTYLVPSGPNSPTELGANAVAPSLYRWAGNNISASGIHYSGSYAKGTGVAGGTDVDLFISLLSTTPGSLAEIRLKLFRWCQTEHWQPRMQDVSIGITYATTRIDLVPARLQPGSTTYHSLSRRSGQWTQTNVQKHIAVVTGSGRQQEIRAIKLWRNLHHLEFPSFYLELFVVDALSGRRHGDLAANVLLALQTIGQRLLVTRIVDPANTNNVVSNDLTLQEKSKIAALATVSAQRNNWNHIIW